MLKRLFIPVLLLSVSCTFLNTVVAQAPTWTIDLLGKEKKPEKFENRKLGSEKNVDKKFTKVRNFFQNNFTHYNYYFNAKNKINTIVERAKAAQKDDYTRLLSYYPFTLENTATQESELDSVIYKATAGILLHDLRNDWVDNMYLLMGQAYYLKKDFDTASATFQFINYNLFPRKKNEEDSRIVGTSDASSNSHISIANTEKQNILQKIAALPPSRNDALIWLARTLIEQNELGESASLINILQFDANLPERLQNDLNDVNAYWFYKQNIFDSSATYLAKALSTADTKQDLSRSEFLLAQLYEMTNQFDKASSYYAKVSSHTVDPLMDIHARLNNAKMLKSTNPEELAISIDNLVKMAKKDKFEAFRDIIFYSAGDLAMQQPDTTAAIGYFNKSLQYNESNISYKNKAFLQLADIAYNQKEYRKSFAWYDSLQTGDTTLDNRLVSIQERRNALAKIVEKIIIVEREDSLQTIAKMSAADRDAFIKKMIKRVRKEKGLKEDDSNAPAGGDAMLGFDNKKDANADLFTASTKGEWYFYNNSAKSKGFSDFKRVWGNRKNADNWRRKNAAETGMGNTLDQGIGLNVSVDDLDKRVDPKNKIITPSTGGTATDQSVPLEDLSYEGLMANIPLTPEKLATSNALLSLNLFELAKLFQEELEDYEQAITYYHQSLTRYPDSLYNGELYLGLYFCYTKLGITDKAAYYKNLVNKNFANSHSALLLNDPAAANPKTINTEGTARYEAIYNLFIEGDFEKAFAEKKKADSEFGNNYWTPQLLYIEAVYHIKQHEDSVALGVLRNMIALYPNAKLAPKAGRMIDVLKRRAEIEDYLSKLEITRATDDEVVKIDERPVLVRNDSNLIKSPVNYIDTSARVIKPATPPQKDIVNTTISAPADAQLKDATKISPVKEINTDVAVIKPGAPPQKENVKTIIAPAGTELKDAVRKSPSIFVNGPFTIDTATVHNVIMVLDKVDGTYINESKNAFTRYLGENYRGQAITLTRDTIDITRSVLVFTSFANATLAHQFLLKLKKAAPDEVSWLPANKYSFYLISDENLQLLKTNKDIAAYIGLLNKVYPGSF